MPWRKSLLLALLVAAGGCRDVERFDTDGDEAYCGTIVPAPFVFEGFPVDLRLRLRIDTDRLDSVPGTITSDDVAGDCAPEPLFKEAELRVTPEVLHDPLSTLEFGAGRDMNLISWVRSGCQGPMLAVVSLMKNDDVELRLLKPPTAPIAPGDEPPAGFALFQLRRQQGTCGF
jgi:hypothetical protein